MINSAGRASLRRRRVGASSVGEAIAIRTILLMTEWSVIYRDLIMLSNFGLGGVWLRRVTSEVKSRRWTDGVEIRMNPKLLKIILFCGMDVRRCRCVCWCGFVRRLGGGWVYPASRGTRCSVGWLPLPVDRPRRGRRGRLKLISQGASPVDCSPARRGAASRWPDGAGNWRARPGRRGASVSARQKDGRGAADRPAAGYRRPLPA